MVIADIPLFLTARTTNETKSSIWSGFRKYENLRIDRENCRVAYAVLSFGGFLGLGNKLLAVHCEALSVRLHEYAFVFYVNEKNLKKRGQER